MLMLDLNIFHNTWFTLASKDFTLYILDINKYSGKILINF